MCLNKKVAVVFYPCLDRDIDQFLLNATILHVGKVARGYLVAINVEVRPSTSQAHLTIKVD